MKIGDKVRFLDSIGGGKVSGFQGSNIVLVEDEDGFEIPTLITQCVVVTDEGDARAAGHAPIHEAPLTERARQIVEAKTENIRLEEENRILKDEISRLRAEIDQMKLALLKAQYNSNPKDIAKGKAKNNENQPLKALDGSLLPGVLRNGIIEVDLHINELLETTSGMDNAAILKYQLSVFRKTMDTYKKCKNQRIVFIHGKGEGVLRRALIDDLKLRYPLCTYQDASFQQYGFGATMITIH